MSGIKFLVSTKFESVAAKRLFDLLNDLVARPEIAAALRSLNGKTIYIAHDNDYQAHHNYTAFIDEFYTQNASGELVLDGASSGVPLVGDRITIGAPNVAKELAGQGSTIAGGVTDQIRMHLSRTLFHELYHAVIRYTAPDVYNSHVTGYDFNEVVTVAAENLIHTKNQDRVYRVGHSGRDIVTLEGNAFFRQSKDPSAPFAHVQDISADSGRIRGQYYYEFKGTDESGGVIRKAYYEPTVWANYTVVSGTKVGLIENDGKRSQTFLDVLSGVLSPAGKVDGDISFISKTIQALGDQALGQLGNKSDSLSSLLTSFAMSDFTTVYGLSNERWTDGRPTTDLVGPASTYVTNGSVAYLDVVATSPAILIGASGHTRSQAFTLGQNRNRAAVDRLNGSDDGPNLLLAGNGPMPGAISVTGAAVIENELTGGRAGNIIIGGAGNDRMTGKEGDDIFVTSPGKDRIIGGGGSDIVVLRGESKRVDADQGKTIITTGDYKTTVDGVNIFVGGDTRVTFYGDGHKIFIAGAGGAEFHLKSGDVAIGNPAAREGNVYYVTTEDMIGGRVGIVGFGKNDKLFVDGKRFDGSTAISTSLGMSYDSNHDGPGNAGVFNKFSSSWGTHATQPYLYDTFDQPPGNGLRYHYWINGGDLYSPGPIDVRAVTYVKSADDGSGPSGDIYFSHRIASGYGDEPTLLSSFNISITGWQQGYGGIKFFENNLARDTLGSFSIGGGIGGWGGQVLGNQPDAAFEAGFYKLDGQLIRVGDLFDPNSSEWQTRTSGDTAWDKINQLIEANRVGSADAGITDDNPYNDATHYGFGFTGGGGGVGETDRDDDGDTGLSSVLEGDVNANVLDPLGIYTGVAGAGGGDTIIYNQGYGLLTIDERDSGAAPLNTLQLGAGLVASALTVTANTRGDIVLAFGGLDQVVLREALNSTLGDTRGVQQILFDDGTMLTYADLLTAVGTATSSGQVIFGDKNSNVLDTAGIAKYAVGGGGGDTFLFEQGYGTVTVDERDTSGGAPNVLTLGQAFDPWSTSVSGRSDGAIVLDFGNGDRVVLKDALKNSTTALIGVQAITFADGTTWNHADLMERVGTAYSENATIYGDGTANYLWAGGYESSIVGGGGGDTIVFNYGDKPITIVERDDSTSPSNTLVLYGIAAADVTVRANQDGDLILYAFGSPQITVAGALNSTNGITFGVQGVEFDDDGSFWSYADLLDRALVAAPDNTVLYGDGGANVLDAAGIATELVGGGGGDTFRYDRGYGAVTIREAEGDASKSNVLAFGSDIVAGEVAVRGDANGNIILSLGGGDEITLLAALQGDAGVRYGVQGVTFTDATAWTYQDLLARALAPAIGKTAIFGDTGANVLDGGGVSGVAVGNGGGDTFIFNAGYGSLVILEQDTALTPDNALIFGLGIDPADVAIAASPDGDIVLTLTSGDSITLKGALRSNEMVSHGVQRVVFADQTVWTYADLVGQLGTAVAGQATIFGDGAANTLDTAGIAHRVVGRGGGDTILFNQGYGSVVVEEADTTGDADNQLQFGAGIAAAGVTVQGAANGDIVISVGAGDEVILKGALLSTDGEIFGVQSVSFADGTLWTYADLLAKLATPSIGNAVLYGDTAANLLDGGGVAHTLVGNGGGDTFVFNQGYGSLAIEQHELSRSSVSVLRLGAGLTPASASASANAAGDILLSFGGGDEIMLKAALNGSGDTFFGVQRIEFADGTRWRYDDLRVLSQVAGNANTTLYGDRLSDEFDSAGIANTIVGRGGGDTIRYARGYGSLSIVEEDDGAEPSNALVFGSGIRPSDVTVIANSAGDLVLSLGGGDDVILVGAATASPGVSKGVQQVVFDNGLVWSTDHLAAFAAGSWDVADDGGKREIAEATLSATAPPVINLAFDSIDAVVSISADRTSVSITSANGTVITVRDLFRRGILDAQSIVFADNVTWTLGEAVENAGNATDVINYLVGSEAPEDLAFGQGVKHIIGFGGGDRVLYQAGDGRVTLDQHDQAPSAPNILTFGAGIALADLQITSSASDLFLKLTNGDEVVIMNALVSKSGSAFGVQRVDFADGTSATYEQLLAIADTGSSYNDGTLFGDAQANVFDTRGFAHSVVGGGGADVILYGQGYGALSIDDYDKLDAAYSTIVFGAGITVGDISILPDLDSSHLTGLMTILVDGQEIRIGNQLGASFPIIGALTFQDGTVLSYADMLANMATPFAGKAAIGGDFGANTLDTQGLVSQVFGNGGGDTFIYNRGYGALAIREFDSASDPANRLLFGADIDPADVAVTLSSQGYYTLDLSNGDTVTFDAGQFRREAGVQFVEFSNGTIWDLDDLMTEAFSGRPGRISMAGTNRSERFDSRGYTRSIIGWGGSDSYVFASGYGALTISDYTYYGADTNRVEFAPGISPNDVVISEYNGDLILSIGSSDRVVIIGQFGYSSSSYQPGIQGVTFADGTNWSRTYIASRAGAVATGSAASIDLTSGTAASVEVPVTTHGLLTGGGSVEFTDADAGDVHSVSVVAVDYNMPSLPNLASRSVMLNYLSAAVTTQLGGGSPGTFTWTFNAPSSDFDALSPGETVDLHFTVQLRDQNNAVTTQDVVVSVSAGIYGNPATVHSSGTTGADAINLSRNFFVTPGGGDDDLGVSGDGGGTIAFAKYDGHDTLTNYQWYAARQDNLLLTDILDSEVVVTASGNAMTLTVVSTGDTFTATDQFAGDTTGISQIVFANNVVWDRAEIALRVGSQSLDAGFAYSDQMGDHSRLRDWSYDTELSWLGGFRTRPATTSNMRSVSIDGASGLVAASAARLVQSIAGFGSASAYDAVVSDDWSHLDRSSQLAAIRSSQGAFATVPVAHIA